MYAAAHTALALVGKRRVPEASLAGLMLAAQGSELLWVGMTYAGVEHARVDERGTLHLDYLPFSHSEFTSAMGGLLVWLVLRPLPKGRAAAAAYGMVFASHVLLDVVHHEPDIRLAPWSARPRIGLDLQSAPWLDLAVETAFCTACWAYYRGSWPLLAGLVGLNLLNLPLMLTAHGHARFAAGRRALLPTLILGTILAAWGVVWALRQPRQKSARTRPVPGAAVG